jgi:steroid delta-isomerase-like uncharacterized protein
MIRVTRPGGWIVVTDPDWDTLIIDAPDRQLTRKILHASADTTANPWSGRELYRLFHESGLGAVVVADTITLVLNDWATANQLYELDDTVAALERSGSISATDAQMWINSLQQADHDGRFFCAVTGFTVVGQKLQGDRNMSTETNKAAYRGFMDEAFNALQYDRVADYIADDMIEHTPGFSSGAAGVRSDLALFASAFPDIRITIEDLIAEGDQLAARYYWTGTHQGAFAGIAPTGKQVRVRGLDIWRMRDGKCIEHWNIEDNLSLMQQLGAIPVPE